MMNSVHRMNRPVSINRPIEVSVAIPYRMKVIDGGIRMPSVPPAQIEPVATSSGYPRRRISGMPILPMAAQQAGGYAIEPAVERLIEVLAGGRRADRRTHHHEHGYRHQREVGEAGVERLRRHVQRIQALEDHQKGDGDGAEPEGDRRTRQQHHQSDDENDGTLGGGAHVVSFGGSPKGSSRPLASL